MLFLRIYLIGSIIGMILSLFNYLLYLKDNNINHPHYLMYLVELFANMTVIGLFSWIGAITAIVSIILRLKN